METLAVLFYREFAWSGSLYVCFETSKATPVLFWREVSLHCSCWEVS